MARGKCPGKEIVWGWRWPWARCLGQEVARSRWPRRGGPGEQEEGLGKGCGGGGRSGKHWGRLRLAGVAW